MNSGFNLKNSLEAGVKAVVRYPSINTFGVKTVSPWFPAPFEQDFMEFKYGVWDGISTCFTEDGRQLGEDNAGPPLRQQNVPTEYQIARHKDSRNGLTMNVSALRDVMQHWNEAISLILANRELLMSKYNYTSALSLIQLQLLSKLAVALPAYMVRANKQGIDRDLSAMFSIVTGVFMIVEKMISEAEVWLDRATHRSAEELYEYADLNGVFISDHGNVCGGAKSKIIEMIDLMIHGTTEDSKYADGSRALETRAIDCDRFFAYAIYSEKLAKLLQLARIVSVIRGNKHSRDDYIKLGLVNEVIKEIDQWPSDCSNEFSLDDVLPQDNESISNLIDDRLRAEIVRVQGGIHQNLGFQVKPIPETLFKGLRGR